MVKKKVIGVTGDIVMPKLGLSVEEYAHVTSNINAIINSAASVEFNQRIDQALRINTLGPQNVLGLAKDCPNLEIFC